MMLKYLQAENLKYKRTFIKKLIFLAPVVTLIIAFLSFSGVQSNAFNSWYMLILFGYISLMAALVNQKEEKKLNYQAVFTLPISLKKIWIAKNLVIAVYVLFSCIVLSVEIILGGLILPITTTITIFHAFAAAVLIAITFLWQIPFCLFLAKKFGFMATLLINVCAGILLSISAAKTWLWWICPYSWAPRLMCADLGILPNGLSVEAGSNLLNPIVIPIGIILSLALFALLLVVTANWFKNQEVK